MVFLKNLFGWMLVTKKDDSQGIHPDLNPLDLDELKAELRVEFEARRLGEIGLPRPDETNLSGPEHNILQRLESIRRDYVNWATSRLKNIQARMLGCDITKTYNRSMQASQEFERAANGCLSDHEAHLCQLRSLAQERQEELRVFKLNNNLTRSGMPVSFWRNLSFVSLILLIVFIEGFLNAQFFAKSLDGGLLQGFFFAFFLALMNVSVAIIIGRIGVPNKNHVNPIRQAFGWLSLCVAVAIMVLMGLVIAHFRDSLAQGLDGSSIDTGKLALETLINNPFSLNDIYSWMLFAFSICFGALGLAEGYYWHDTYPGYGKIQKESNKAAEDYESYLAEIRQSLEELKNEHLTNLEESVEEASTFVREYKEHIHEKASYRNRLERALHKAENTLEALIRTFRTDNETHRRKKNAPTPAYFAQSVGFQEVELPNFDTSEDERTLAKQQLQLDRLLDRVEHIRAEIQSSFDVKFDQYKPIRDQIQ